MGHPMPDHCYNLLKIMFAAQLLFVDLAIVYNDI